MIPQYRNLIILIVGALICIGVSTYIRLYPWRVNLSGDAHEKASMMVVYQIKQNFFENIMRQNPSMPIDAAENLAMKNLNELMHQNPKRVMQAIDKASAQITKNSNETQVNYLLESDPFYYYNLTENIATSGKIASTIKGSKYLNPLMNAPEGSLQPFTLHPYLGFWLYKTLTLFNPSITLMTATALLPVIISALSILLFCFIGFQLSSSSLATLTGCFIFTLTPIYLKRSAMGWYDTDPYNVFFTLLLLGIMILGLRHSRTKDALYYGIGYGIAIVLFALIWQGWIMMFIVGILSTLGLLGLSFINKTIHQHLKPCLFFLSSSILTASLCVMLTFGPADFISLFAEGFGELNKFTVKGLDVWPNLFMGVGELKKTTLFDFVNSLGGWWVIALSLLAALGVLINHIFNYKPQKSIETALIGALLLAALFLSLGAERFILFALVPMTLLLTQAFELLPTNRFLKPTVMAIVCLTASFNANASIATTVTPIFNSTWDKALHDLREHSPANAIINTWWPPGHFIKAIANRGVLFDGATLSEGAVGYWFSRALLSNNETYAQGIFRMINSSRNQSVDFLIKRGLKTSDAVTLIETLAPLSGGQIRSLLTSRLNNQDITTLIGLMKNNPNSYLLLYNEIIDENLILSFTGNWDIKKIEAINANPTLMSKLPKRGSSEFIDFCWTIAGGQTKSSDPFNLISQDNDTLNFTNGLSINKNTMQATINSPVFGQGHPLSVFYRNGNNLVEQTEANPNLNYSVIVYKDDKQLFARLMDRSIANSLLIKLYFYDGIGLTYFKPLKTFNDLSKRTVIKTFEINWKN